MFAFAIHGLFLAPANRSSGRPVSLVLLGVILVVSAVQVLVVLRYRVPTASDDQQ